MAGETTSVSAATVRTQPVHVGSGAFLMEFDLTYSATQNELNDVMEAGYLPPYTRVYAVLWGDPRLNAVASLKRRGKTSGPRGVRHVIHGLMPWPH